jgi:predicted TIM-barrel fold metal-dependent hydrolase
MSPKAVDAVDAVPEGQDASLSVYDADVHHGWVSKADLYPYLSSVYRERLHDYGIGGAMVRATDAGVRGYRADALPDGEVPVSAAVASPSVDLTRSHLLDGCGVGWALLTGGPVSMVGAHADLDYGSAMARAFNDFSVEHWLGADDRFRLALTVNHRDPRGAADEIARLGEDPRVVAVVVSSGAMMPFGQRFYQPIHEACAELGLVLAIHWGSDGFGVNPSPTAVGYPGHYAETSLSRSSVLQVHLTSFVFEGVFERYPTFKVAVLEGGFGWVPAYLWFIDQTWENLRYQTPWVKRPPSEYLVEHVRFSARPIDRPMLETAIDDILDWMKADQTLMFASDYPRVDWADSAATLATVPESLRERIFHGNARSTFRG